MVNFAISGGLVYLNFNSHVAERICPDKGLGSKRIEGLNYIKKA